MQVGQQGDFLTVMAKAGALPSPGTGLGCSYCEADGRDALLGSLLSQNIILNPQTSDIKINSPKLLRLHKKAFLFKKKQSLG